MSKVLIAGATGELGSRVLAQLADGDDRIRTLSRSANKREQLAAFTNDCVFADATVQDGLAGVCDGVDVVFSALGATVSTATRDRRPFSHVDLVANRNLLGEAKRAGVRRFVYVAVCSRPGYAQSAYVRAHDQFVADLEKSGLSFSVLRPTGFFSALEAFLPMARRGVIPLIGDGSAISNPIHPDELASLAVKYLHEGPAQFEVGGPEIVSRRQIASAAFDAVGKQPRFITVPPLLFRIMSVLLRPLHPRLAELLEFVGLVSTTDCVAPTYGTQTVAAYFMSRTASSLPL